MRMHVNVCANVNINIFSSRFESGIFQATVTTSRTSKLTAQTNPDLVRNAGEILYLNNIDAVSRSNTTTETVRLVITF